ncbi:Homeobox-leucine zipper protein HOX13 [Apostasia shenzhenica]|uniref:Homeobox-leucine zipper protein n=1 Tax=Apostasia shenzhenica TaxID=1088818 RepID=A0A2I0BEU1_9ASPA|nr:Homeobox-leucine zipper protein HOX13 [Apostasia shenzhenica]
MPLINGGPPPTQPVAVSSSSYISLPPPLSQRLCFAQNPNSQFFPHDDREFHLGGDDGSGEAGAEEEAAAGSGARPPAPPGGDLVPEQARALEEAKQLERSYAALRADYDSLRADFESLLHQKDVLAEEVRRLAEELGRDQSPEEGGGGSVEIAAPAAASPSSNATDSGEEVKNENGPSGSEDQRFQGGNWPAELFPRRRRIAGWEFCRMSSEIV